MTTLSDLLATLAADLLTDRDDRLAADALASRMAVGGTSGARAALDFARLIGEAGDPAATLAALDRLALDATSDAALAVAAIVIACFATIRADYPSRQDATAAREAMSTRAQALYPALDPAGAVVMDWCVRLVGETVTHLSAVAATRVPVVRVETGVPLPSTLVAWDLYGDASRAGEIVQRNRLATPMILPTAFEATAG